MDKQPVMLIILDGWGIGDKNPGNAIYLGDTKTYDYLIENYPNSQLEASGEYVGLPMGQMGNSEVGHLNIGSGRVVYQDLPMISKEIERGSFFENREFLKAINYSKKKESNIHLIGLVSDGGVHSHQNHLYGLLDLMDREDVDNVYIHSILDGRDVPPKIGSKHIKALEEKIAKVGKGKIASISGRYYAMDRDKRWDRTELAYNAIVLGEGKKRKDPVQALEESYKEGLTDEFIEPIIIEENWVEMKDNDVIIFFNFRPDRARQLTRAFVDKDFQGFSRKKKIKSYFVTMTEYDKTIENVKVAYRKDIPKNTLSETLSKKNLRQAKIAETEKYAHVTFFLNGGLEEAYEGEDRFLIPSPKVRTYDLEPKMSANLVKEKAIEIIKENKHDFIVMNFANPDMVGHTGMIEETIEAIEEVDRCLGEVLDVLEKNSGIALITADHGNAEMLLDENNNTVTAHTTNPVPLILFSEKNKIIKNGKLADIAPTLLELLGIDKPEEMTGSSLLK